MPSPAPVSSASAQPQSSGAGSGGGRPGWQIAVIVVAVIVGVFLAANAVLIPYLLVSLKLQSSFLALQCAMLCCALCMMLSCMVVYTIIGVHAKLQS